MSSVEGTAAAVTAGAVSPGTGHPDPGVAALPAGRRRLPGPRQAWSMWLGLTLVAVHLLVALAAPLLTSYDPEQPTAGSQLLQPSADHWLGTDSLGRDVLARVLHGGRYALVVSASATVVAVALGALLGCAAAYHRGWFDEVLMRVLDAVLSVPAILALLVVVSVLGNGTAIIVTAAVVVYCPAVIRVIRAAALSVVVLDYVTAARARGEGFWATSRREIWPNVLDVVMVEFAMRASWVLLLVSSLSFLGFGANPPTPDWGLMVAENRALLQVVPAATIGPIAALATLILGLNLAADGFAKSRGIDRMRGAAG